MQAIDTKLRALSKNLTGNNSVCQVIVHGHWCCHGNHIFVGSFLKHLNFTVMNENKFKKFVSLTFTFLDHLSVLLLLFITFWAILMACKGFGKSKKSKMADPRWPPLFEIMT